MRHSKPGHGFHVSLWVAGCTHNCKNCFNPQSHDFNAGKLFTEETMQKILRELRNGHNSAFTLTGGDPLHPRNCSAVKEICRRIKEEIGCPIWLWTGYYIDELNEAQMDVLRDVDYIVDGRFEEDKKDISLAWRGSSNQSIFWHAPIRVFLRYDV